MTNSRGTQIALLAWACLSPLLPATPQVAARLVAAATCTGTDQSAVSTWSTRRLASQVVVVPVDENDVAAAGPEVSAGAGGVILFGSTAPADLGPQLAALKSQAPGGIRPFVMTDEEGGVVQRMANLVGSMPAARDMGASMSPARIRDLARSVGTRMHRAGVTMDLAPVLDLDDGPGPSDSNPDGTRSFSIRRRVATADGLAFARGLRDAGVVPVVKHFPGLGGATANTDVTSAYTRPWSVLRSDGVRPFSAAVRAGLPAVMVANAQVPGLGRRPASLSPAVVGKVLRGRLGFHGLVVTDSLSAGAVRDAGYGLAGGTVQALRAGADMVMFDEGSAAVTAARTRSIVRTVVAAVRHRRLSRARLEDAVVHVLQAKHIELCR